MCCNPRCQPVQVVAQQRALPKQRVGPVRDVIGDDASLGGLGAGRQQKSSDRLRLRHKHLEHLRRGHERCRRAGGLQRLREGIQCALRVGGTATRLDHFANDAHRIGQTGPRMRGQQRSLDQAEQALPQGQQVAGEVAAVDRRYVVRRQWTEGFGVVPVVEVTAITRQRVERGKGVGRARHQPADRQVAEVHGGQVRQQRHADVGRRGAAGHDQRGMFLHVVGREPVIVRVDVGFKKAPRAPCKATEVLQLRRGQHDGCALLRPAHPPHQQGRQGPQRQDRARDDQRRRLQREQREHCRHRGHRCRPHRQYRCGQVVAERAFDLTGRVPSQQPTPTQHPVSRTRDRIEAQERLEGEGGQGQWCPREAAPGREEPLAYMRLDRHIGGASRQIHHRREQWRQQQRRQHPRRANERLQGAFGEYPHQHQQCRGGHGHQAAAQVVGQLATRQQRQRIALTAAIGARRPRHQPRQQLPVTPDPAVAALDVHGVTRRVVLIQLHVADQSSARVTAFDQVVAEDPVVRHASRQCAFERIDVIDALADERALVEQVLVHVRHGTRVRIDARLTAVHTRIPAARLAAHADADAWLQDPVAARDHVAGRIEAGAIERMRQRADQFPRRIARQLGVGVQRDHVTHVAQRAGIAGDAHEGTVASTAAQVGIQRCQLAALALAPHPAVFARVPHPRSMEQEKHRAVVVRQARVERIDPLTRGIQQRCVGVHHLAACIEEIGEQREAQVPVAVGQVADFKRFDQHVHAADAADQGRHRHEGPGVAWNALGIIESRQRTRRGHQHRDPVHDGNAELAEGNNRQNAQQPDHRGPQPDPLRRQQPISEGRDDQRDGCGVRGVGRTPRDASQRADQPLAE